MFGIGVILSLIGYFGLEIEPRLIIPFLDLEIQPVIVAISLFASFALGLIMLSVGLAVLLYSMKKPPADKE